MTQLDRMREWYAERIGGQWLDEYIDMHRRTGVVVETPEFFVMGRPVASTAADCWIRESMRSWPRQEQDAWYVFAFAGDLRRVWEAIPYPLPLICFNRHGQKNLRFYPSVRMNTLCGKYVAQQTRRSALRSDPPEGDAGDVQT